jgi:hypothetical protein
VSTSPHLPFQRHCFCLPHTWHHLWPYEFSWAVAVVARQQLNHPVLVLHSNCIQLIALCLFFALTNSSEHSVVYLCFLLKVLVNVHKFPGLPVEYPVCLLFHFLRFSNKVILTKNRNHITTELNNHLRTPSCEEHPYMSKCYSQLMLTG